jgi:hypothetical protein
MIDAQSFEQGLPANSWPARCNSAVDTKQKPGDTNETQTIHS